MHVEMEMPDGSKREETIKFGDILQIPLPIGSEANVTITPNKGFDIWDEHEAEYTGRILGGEAGVILDGRGRPLELPVEAEKRKEALMKWIKVLDLYPKDGLDKLLKEMR